ncbi:NAD-dependent epimerase/dehydratase family protein [Sinorhizobium sp. 8-89]|uniref:NAD-dependent epimerase/dehydratase family protein n=1 Tax=Sinorhizobium sp. 8-89 TaxID=3049089 RepID=UPI00386BFE21
MERRGTYSRARFTIMADRSTPTTSKPASSNRRAVGTPVPQPRSRTRDAVGKDLISLRQPRLGPPCVERPPTEPGLARCGENVFEAARSTGASVADLSSAGVFGTFDAVHPESLTLYGVTKLAVEGIARVYAADCGVGSVGLRPYVVYGPGESSGISAGPSLARLDYVRHVQTQEPYELTIRIPAMGLGFLSRASVPM